MEHPKWRDVPHARTCQGGERVDDDTRPAQRSRPAPAGTADEPEREKEVMNRLAAAAGTLAAFGLATPIVVAFLVPGLPIALAAVLWQQWKGRDA